MRGDDFTDEDYTPPGYAWTREDELARMRHRQALAAWPTTQPLGVMHTQTNKQIQRQRDNTDAT
jgi:hypothetical protein